MPPAGGIRGIFKGRTPRMHLTGEHDLRVPFWDSPCGHPSGRVPRWSRSHVEASIHPKGLIPGGTSQCVREEVERKQRLLK
jgi:hypothetical protein